MYIYVFNKVYTFERDTSCNTIGILQASSELVVESDHPECHDLWETVVIVRDSALTENICVGVSDCERSESWPNIFIPGQEKKRKGRREEEKRD